MASKREQRERRKQEKLRRVQVILEERERLEKAGRKLKGFANHFIAFVVIMAAMTPVNMIFRPEEPWYLVIGVGWILILAVHLIVASGVFGGRKKS